jgi:hypothetical protein
MVGSPDLDSNLRRVEYKVGILTYHDVGWNKVIGITWNVMCPQPFVFVCIQENDTERFEIMTDIPT